MEHKTDVSNQLTIRKVKELFCDATNEKNRGSLTGKDQAVLDPDMCRFFYCGKECKDDLFIYSYEMTDDMTIQCMYRK
jgi:hypothetical protein